MNPPSGLAQTPARHELTERLIARERWIVAASLGVLVALCWWYLAVMADAMAAMTDPGRSTAFMWLMPMGRWDLAEFTLAALMWIVMMIGMMVPSAAPVILLYALIRRKQQLGGGALAPTAVFLGGYLAVWSGFSVAAAGVQFGLSELRMMSDLMQSESRLLSASILVAAGVYQLSPWKAVCLSQCRSPITFLSAHWRPGRLGALRMGIAHGAYCVGCCWLAMCVLFAVGVMNLAWVAALSALVLVEKLASFGTAIARLAGILLVGAGFLVLIRAV